MKILTDNIIKTSSDMFSYLLEQQRGTFVFSPYSIINILGILLNGSTNNTKNMMEEFLYYEDNTDKFNDDIYKINHQLHISPDDSIAGSSTLKLNNYVFYNNQIKMIPLFEEIIKKYFKTESQTFDPTKTEEILNIINETVKTNTNGLIENLFDELPGNLLALIVNTMYFKLSWKLPFEIEHENRDFADGEMKIQVPMMKISKEFRAFETDGYQAVQIPYADHNYSFLGILPKSNKKEDLNIENIEISKLLLKMKLYDVEIRIPKFKFKTEIDIIREMKMEKLQEIFTNPSFLNMFSGVPFGNPELFHVAVIDVNEKGTEGASVTSTFARLSLNILPKMTINFNRPFIFYIVKTISDNNTPSSIEDLPIFMGRFSGNINEHYTRQEGTEDGIQAIHDMDLVEECSLKDAASCGNIRNLLFVCYKSLEGKEIERTDKISSEMVNSKLIDLLIHQCVSMTFELYRAKFYRDLNEDKKIEIKTSEEEICNFWGEMWKLPEEREETSYLEYIDEHYVEKSPERDMF
ncbi:alpha-1-antitrypsin-like protein [Vairimorpha necatrix]|uniref:Alpha-1-antitrypsin-like protein n=1 Tax=Vairimorpha necatrix TaxID=6039 RepID=A0AAX4JBE7_9MICR